MRRFGQSHQGPTIASPGDSHALEHQASSIFKKNIFTKSVHNILWSKATRPHHFNWSASPFLVTRQISFGFRRRTMEKKLTQWPCVQPSQLHTVQVPQCATVPLSRAAKDHNQNSSVSLGFKQCRPCIRLFHVLLLVSPGIDEILDLEKILRGNGPFFSISPSRLPSKRKWKWITFNVKSKSE